MTTELDLYELETKIGDKVAEIDKKVALLEQKIDLLMTNHLAHIQKDVDRINALLWGALGGLVVNLVAVIFLLIKMN